MENNVEAPSPIPAKTFDLPRFKRVTKKFTTQFLKLVLESMDTGDFSAVEEHMSQFDPSIFDSERVGWERIQEDSELSLRKFFLTRAMENPYESKFDSCRNLMRLVHRTLCKQNARPFFSAYVVTTIFADVFDVVTVDAAEAMFKVLEEFRELWKAPPFCADANRNHLLRLCNALLRRLSKSQNTEFCSRILLFLASVLPPAERSGLNVIGEFNLDNITQYSTEDEKLAKDVKGGKKLERKAYETFWGLQDFFRNPMQLHTGANFKKFKDACDEVFRMFSACKLDPVQGEGDGAKGQNNSGLSSTGRPRGDEAMDVDGSPNPGKVAPAAEKFFAKYLTNFNLMDLELRDSTFRRSFLTQFMIIAQFHLHPFKFRQDKTPLTNIQRRWLYKSCNLALKLIRETPPDGPRAANFLRRILLDERRWIHWKNTSCKQAVPVNEPPKKIQKVDANGVSQDSSITAAAHPKEYLAALSGIQKMKDTLAAKKDSSNALQKLCALPKKGQYALARFGVQVPSIEDFCGDVLKELDKKEMGPKAKRLLNDPSFTWRTMRLMKTKSPNFFVLSLIARSTTLKPSDALLQLLKESKPKVPTEKGVKNDAAATAGEPSSSAQEIPRKEDPPSDEQIVLENGTASEAQSRAESMDGEDAEETVVKEEPETVTNGDLGEDVEVKVEPEEEYERSTSRNEGEEDDEELALVDEIGEGVGDTDTEEAREEDESEPRREDTKLTTELIDKIAPSIEGKWLEVGKRLQFKEDELEHFKTESKGNALEATKMMLGIWVDQDDDPTLENLSYWCDAVGIKLEQN